MLIISDHLFPPTIIHLHGRFEILLNPQLRKLLAILNILTNSLLLKTTKHLFYAINTLFKFEIAESLTKGYGSSTKYSNILSRGLKFLLVFNNILK